MIIYSHSTRHGLGTEGRGVDAIADWLNRGNRASSAPERAGPGSIEQHIPLLGYELPPQSCVYQALAILW